jgi:hypothetical protein
VAHAVELLDSVGIGVDDELDATCARHQDVEIVQIEPIRCALISSTVHDCGRLDDSASTDSPRFQPAARWMGEDVTREQRRTMWRVTLAWAC